MTFRLALVTGATGGLGSALSDLLAKENIPLLLTGRDPEKLNVLARQYNAQAIVCDLRNRAPLIAAIHTHSPDLIINNAGFAHYGDALSRPTKDQCEASSFSEPLG
ncbi:MAG: SDR family NAD(P)-dependent oxidoreductase [Verrucomicrobiota bacterium]|nr:SDR family NAD(P)-dependent oxidoreductase [Verrucomicrobiota bacterium]